MGKPRQRPTHPVIIDRPELRSPLRNLIELSLTGILWSLWIYFITPAVTLFLWFVGIKFFYQALFPGGGFIELFGVMKNAGLTIIIVFTINMIWINYNYYWIYKRFGERRKQSVACSNIKFAHFLKIDPELVEKAKASSRLQVTLKDNKLTLN